MEITVKTEQFALRVPFTISRGTKVAADVVTVEIRAGGAVGRGECVPYARYGESLLSVTDQIKGLPGKLAREDLPRLLPSGAARNAVDCALWDLEAKQRGARVWALASLKEPGPEICAYTLSLGAAEEMELAARENAHRPLLKIKLGTPEDMPRLEAVRRGAPRTRLIVDANEGWSAEIYSELAPHLLRLGVNLVEQPVPADQDESLIGLIKPVPVCADESCHDRESLKHLKGKYDVINIKLDKTGGLTEALALKRAAMEEGYGIMVGCMVGTSLGMAPAVLAAQGVGFTDLDGPLLLKEDRVPPLAYDGHGVHPSQAALWG
ncbi:MAG: dipeptide epimerase [Vannielia sp.]|uniref:N-acetyl-D-Glu racemase DgcA n=1 Tax=Vannielia sp. TaxID=2813045 RepID=UPI003B8E71F0